MAGVSPTTVQQRAAGALLRCKAFREAVVMLHRVFQTGWLMPILHNRRLATLSWHRACHWSTWPTTTLRAAILKAANKERQLLGHRGWWFWHRVRMRMVAFHQERFGEVPAILLARTVPADPLALGRDAAFLAWYSRRMLARKADHGG